MTTYSATRVAPEYDDAILAEGSLEEVVSAAVRFGAKFDDNQIEAVEQGRQPMAWLRYGAHPDEYVRIEVVGRNRIGTK